jgi:anaerobic selenocysteine-containing dehydrogenase
MLVTVNEAGRAIKVEGDPNHPATDGVLCTKVTRYTERTYHKDRLLYPMRRMGNKGEGKFVRITWDEALDEIASRLTAIAQRAPEAIVPYSYGGTMGYVQSEGMAARLFNKLGGSRLDRTICASAGAAGMRTTYGAGVCYPPLRNWSMATSTNRMDTVTSCSVIRLSNLEIHPVDAAQRGIQEGQDLRVFNERGEFQVKAVITERIRPGVVMAYSIWWKKMGRDGKNCNEVASQALTDLGNAATFYDCLVEVA